MKIQTNHGARGEMRSAPGTGFWTVLSLLLGAARRRALGRQKRQQELLRQRSKKPTMNWNALAFFGAFMLGVFINGSAAYVLHHAVDAGERLEMERGGKVVVSGWFKKQVERVEAERAASFPRTRKLSARLADRAIDQLYGRDHQDSPTRLATKNKSGFPVFQPQITPALVTKVNSNFPRSLEGTDLERAYSTEARRITRAEGGQTEAVEARLRAAVRTRGSLGLVAEGDVPSGFVTLGNHTLPALLGSLVLGWWMLMLTFQGEGLELDLQRRRHPMWEFLYAHPVPASAVFAAEMLSPFAANPIYWSGPVFVGFVYGQAYDAGAGMAAVGLVGMPVTLALGCLGKALEIGSVIRFSPRSRGALLGLMSWLGYASLMLFLVGAASVSKVVGVVGPVLAPLRRVAWPLLGTFLGRQADGTYSYWYGVATCALAATLVTGLAVRFCVWGANRGLSGNFGGTTTAGPSGSRTRVHFGKDPLYRKEFLWFVRDRSAIVQSILIPLTVAGFQLFNLRGLLATAQGSWNYLCGAAILFGTYFLWVLGPKSLVSEGGALWLSLTWPRGLESLLKAKAFLWSLISTGVVTLTLLYAAFLFPAEAWKVALVGLGWLVFGRSMAEKTVTLVTVTSSSGEPEPMPRGRRWAAALGMLTFAVGVLTQQWPVAVTGIVYSYLTAAAMWENFRARLPFLYDPWSEKLPPPPTLMHAMVSISILVEVGAVLTGIVAGLGGREYLAVGRAVAYALCALAVSVGVANFLAERGVSSRDVWFWQKPGVGQGMGGGEAETWTARAGEWARVLGLGAAGGAALGLGAKGYTLGLLQIPAAARLIEEGQRQMAQYPGLHASYAICAVGVAPFAEEYLFRGLLFRALDREWGGWRAVVGSAAFFAIYHPPLAWLPVGLLGAANALIFKRTGKLAPAVALHLVYNAVVVW